MRMFEFSFSCWVTEKVASVHFTMSTAVTMWEVKLLYGCSRALIQIEFMLSDSDTIVEMIKIAIYSNGISYLLLYR